MKRKYLYMMCCAAFLMGCDDSNDNNGAPNQDIPFCGNGICDNGETANSCPADCKTGNGEQQPGGNGEQQPGGNGEQQPGGNGEQQPGGNDEQQPGGSNDGELQTKAECGDGSCNGEETYETCPLDCSKPHYCGDKTCDSDENRASCPKDCLPECGDGLCEGGEHPDTCPEDCPSSIEVVDEVICGDGVCDDEEKAPNSAKYCASDCKTNVDEELKQLSMDEFNSLSEPNIRFLFDFDAAAQPSADTKDKKEIIEDFFAFPYPSELRTDENGHPDLSNYPLPDMGMLELVGTFLPSIKSLVPSLVKRVQTERAGFSPIGGVYFRSSVPLENLTDSLTHQNDLAKTAEPDSCFQLINVEENSSHYGERVPLYITFHRTTNELWAQNTLVMRPVPGIGPNPGDRYAAVVTNCLKINGISLKQSNKLRYILAKAAPESINKRTSYYVDQLAKLEKDGKLGFKMSDIRAMTGYQTSDVAADMDQMANALKGQGKIISGADGVATQIGGWDHYSYYNAYVFRGQFETCNFIEGKYADNKAPDYSRADAGVINFDEKGKLVSTCKKEKIFFEITVPNGKLVPEDEIPAKGFPIAIYGHGTGGDARTHARYGNSEGLEVLKGKVPMAMLGFDACLQGNRTSAEGSETALYMTMLQNPVVVRESVRQTVNDMLVLYDLIDSGKLILPPRPCDTKKKANVKFDASNGLYMGHSQGSQEAGLLLGLTDSVKNAFLSAGGGGVLLSFVNLHPDLPKAVSNIIGKISIADMLAKLFNLQPGSISYDTFITNHIVQPLMDPVDPLNFTPRFVREPKHGMHPKNIAQTVGLNDQSTPTATQYAMIASTGLPFIGEVFETADALKLAGLSKSTGNSAEANITTSGTKATGAAMQFKYTGPSNPHFVIYHMESARKAYIDFFKTAITGKTVITVTGKQESPGEF